MTEIQTFTLRGNIFDVMETIRKSHIGHSIVSVEWTSNPEDDQEVVVKLTNAPLYGPDICVHYW